MSDTGWHLDKRVPVSIILVLILQFAGGAWLASQMRGDIDRTIGDVKRLESQVEVMRGASQTQAVQLGRIEENVAAMRNEIVRLVRALERQQ